MTDNGRYRISQTKRSLLSLKLNYRDKTHINFATEHSPWANRDLWPVIKKTVNDSTFSLLNLSEIEVTSWLTGELATQWNFPFLNTCFYSLHSFDVFFDFSLSFLI